MKRPLLVALALGLTGCATAGAPPLQIAAPLAASDFAWSTAPGRGSVSGSAVIRTRGGEAKTCAGAEVQLAPDAPYTRERMKALYGSADRAFLGRGHSIIIAGEGADYWRWVRTTACDAAGSFEFSGLPDGVYYLTTSVLWEVPAGTYVPYMDPQGGWFVQRVVVQGGQPVRVILSP